MIDIHPARPLPDHGSRARDLRPRAPAGGLARGLPAVEGSGLGLRDGDATLVVWVEMAGRHLESEVNLMVLGRMPAEQRDAFVVEMAGDMADEWGLTLAGKI